MRCLSLLSSLFVVLSSLYSACATPRSLGSTSSRRGFYTRSHSLGENYKFDSREWHSVNATDMSYRHDDKPFSRRVRSDSDDSTGGTAAHLLNAVWNGLKGIGASETVKITW